MSIERDPRFETWEAERVWLVAREHELIAERESVDTAAEQTAYDAAEAAGYEFEYCEAQAEKVAARRKEIKIAIPAIRARLALIGPYLREEIASKHHSQPPGKKHQRWEKSQESNNYYVGLVERIAVALEKIASALPCESVPEKPKRRRSA